MSGTERGETILTDRSGRLLESGFSRLSRTLPIQPDTAVHAARMVALAVYRCQVEDNHRSRSQPRAPRLQWPDARSPCLGDDSLLMMQSCTQDRCGTRLCSITEICFRGKLPWRC